MGEAVNRTAGAALHKLKPSDYTGLAKGDTGYAYDADTRNYWTGTQLVPSASSQPAQVADQDEELCGRRLSAARLLAFGGSSAG